MSNFFELIAKRESCRSFDPARKIPREELSKIVEAGRLAPSACNSQPWFFNVVESSDLLPQVSGALSVLGLNAFTKDCAAFIVITEEKAKLSMRVAEAFSHQHYAQMDIGIVTAHLALAAAELGVGSCIIGCFNEGKLCELLSIDKSRKVRLVLALGYAATDGLRPKVRRTLDEVSRFF